MPESWKSRNPPGWTSRTSWTLRAPWTRQAAKQQTSDIGKGTGLGLPKVYGFAQQSGARLSLDSQVGAGTVVTLLLPRCERRPAAAWAAPDVTAIASPRRGSLLLVEDDAEVAALTREMLGGLGFDVTHVSSAAAALGALANGRAIDVDLSDVMMPGGMNGLQLAREIRSRHPGLRVVLTTGYSQATQGMHGEEFVLLVKPYTLYGLRSAFGSGEAGPTVTPVPAAS